MYLRELIEAIGLKYDRTLGMSSQAQKLLRGAKEEVEQWIPGGYIAQGSGGTGGASYCPWIAIFDPDETTTAQRGMYVVYLFAADMKTVALTLNQGVTELRKTHGGAKARKLLKQQAEAIRSVFNPADVQDLEATIDLRATATLPVDYEYGNILARIYTLTDLPTEQEMVADLQRFVRLYALALEGREEVRQSGDAAIVTAPVAKPPPKKKTAEFKPKSDADYRQTIEQQVIVKTKKHETLVKEYGLFLQAAGFEVATNVHPRDLVADRDDAHWLIEAKIVKAGNGVHAAREAVGQLLFYSFFLYEASVPVGKVALFSEAVGEACVQLLEQLGIAAVWKNGHGWAGSPAAVAGGLC
ncbi:MrcB family domain-containing protein [Micromonospora sp. KC721]|uniref:MrcB family domain-containing protein n=1 Tax=Micromonospora sp. KC721 TaxID=2530380 RepID=UPI0014054942|nr:DUF3578 domain-containing protein [Micromonospora sp. KC721]